MWRSFVRFSRCHTDRMPRRAATDGSGPEPSATLRSRHVEATRRAVLGAARSLFGQKGYAQTSVDEIAAAALVTKGAVYHHFADKKALFRAVYSEVEAEAQARTAEAIDPAGSAIDQIVAGVSAYLDVALDDEVRRITLIDGPTVLGLDPGVLAHLIGGLALLGGLLIARASDPDETRAALSPALDAMLRGLAPGDGSR